jgi:hypothetical protein
MLSQLAPWLARLTVALLFGVIRRWVVRAPRGGPRFAIVSAAIALLIVVLDVV